MDTHTVSSLAVLVGGLLTLTAFFVRRFTPSATSWWHTRGGGALIVVVAMVLTSCAEAVAKQGLSLSVLIAAAGQAMLAAVAIADPKGPLPAPDVSPAKDNPSPPPTPPAALLLCSLLPLASACACFTPSDPKYNTTGCIVARGAVDCGIQGIGGALVPVLGSLTKQDYDGTIDALKRQGTLAGGCLLADIGNALTPSPRAGMLLSAPSPDRLAKVSSALADWKRDSGLTGVSLCFTTTDGKRACR